jgi:hypothetical protein
MKFGVIKVVLKELKKGFNSFVILVAWELWKQQCDCIFNSISPSLGGPECVSRRPCVVLSRSIMPQRAAGALASSRCSSIGSLFVFYLVCNFWRGMGIIPSFLSFCSVLGFSYPINEMMHSSPALFEKKIGTLTSLCTLHSID